MSTQFFRFRPPFTSAHVEQRGTHMSVKLWVNHALAGTLTIHQSELSDMMHALRGSVLVATRSAGPNGMVLECEDLREQILSPIIGEDGAITSVAELIASGCNPVERGRAGS